MKKTLLLIATVLCCAMTMFAQNNNKISYQAVVRDTENKLVANKNVTVTVKIFDGDAQQPAYTQTYENVHTNLNGLISLQIGPAQSNEAWNGIHWNNARIETTVTLDGADAPLGTLAMPLTAVPYALYADFADSVNPNVIANYLASHNIPDGAEVNVQSDWKQTNPQADDYIKNKPDLTQYATKDALNDTAAAIREDFPTVPTDVSAFNNDIGYLTSYTESQVLSISHDTIFLTGGSFVKLPAGFSGNYHDLVDTPTKVSSFVNDAGYIKSYTETDPTVKDSLVIITVNGNINEPAGSFTLNQNANDTINIVETDPTVPDWAKTESKPTYDYSEITNTPNIKDTIGTYLTNNHYINQTTLDSKHYLTSDSTVIKNLQSNVTNLLADTAKYATKKALKDTATVLRGLIDNKADASSVYTKTESDARYLQSYTETDPTVKNSLVNIKVNNELAGSFTLNQSSEANINITETDPTVPDWAKTESKPTYDYSEITNTPNIKDTIGTYLTNNHYINQTTLDSKHYLTSDSTVIKNLQSNVTNLLADTAKYATKKALNDTAAVLRGLISTGSTSSATLNTDNSNALITNSSETISGEVKLHKISKTGSYADLNNRPSIKDSIGDFLYDNKYINNADCETVNLCTLSEQLAALRTDMRNSIDSLKHTIDSLEGVIKDLTTVVPQLSLHASATQVAISNVSDVDVASVICSATLTNADGYTIHWKVDGTDSTSSNSTLTVNFTVVGTHKVLCTATKDGFSPLKDSVTITVTKGTPTVTAPTAINPTYNGDYQNLVNEGSTTGGTLQYKLNDGEYSTSIPGATNAGNYTVYYKVVGNDNWNDVVEASVEASIAKAALTSLSVTIDGWTSGQTASSPSVTGNSGNGAVTYSYKVQGAEDNTYTTDVPTAAGDYTVRASVAETDNYLAGTATANFTIAAPAPSVPEGAINGKFTVNAGGTKVYFSQGNLQATYNGSAWSWAFATNQWDYIGNAAGNTSINGNGTVNTNNVTVDLFGWVGNSSNFTGAAQYGISNSTATNNKNGYGDNASENLKSDWGNTIDGTGTTWRTLTNAEWVWVIGPSSSSPNPGTNCRTSSTVNGVENARFAKATVAGKAGLIIFPDSYTHPGDVTAPTSINTASAAFTVNTYDATAWGKMEAAGAVFLPAAGYRSAVTVNRVGECGYYWSSTSYSSEVTRAKRSVYFANNSVVMDYYDSRASGFSVRLVRVAN